MSMQRSFSTQQFPIMRNTRSSIQSSATLQRSQSLGNCIIEKKRGFKPSDRYDPVKKEFLVNLSKQIWHKEPKAPGPKPVVDLQKIFTPAADADEILPQKNRKLYASSAFYSPTLHPTVEDQVELARRISHSLSDINNQQSKGQSMFVNRKKRSVKWVHEGDGKDDIQQFNGYSEETKENSYQSTTSTTSVHHEKIPLKLLMNPRGQVQDFSTVPHQGFSLDSGLLSPDKCAELVTALHAPKGKGAELFAKRRKKSEKWIVDECNAATRSPSGLPYGRPAPTSPIVPAYSDLGVHRVQLNMHQDLVQDKYAQPRLKLVKTPWEAALETGSASSAFQDVRQPPKEEFGTPAAASYDYYQPEEPKAQYQVPPAQKFPVSKPAPNSQRDLAYKPSIPQGWNAPRTDLPKEITSSAYTVPPASVKYESLELNNNRRNSNTYLTSTETDHEARAHNQCKSIEDNFGLRLENFGQSDEDEIVGYMQQISTAATSSSLKSSYLEQSVVNCMAKSPELIVADARENYIQYDHTIKELKSSIVNSHQHKDVTKSEAYHNRSGQQIKQSRHSEPQKERRDQDKVDRNYPNQYEEASFSENNEEKPEYNQLKTDEDPEKDYKKIPVKDLISSFEKQTIPIMRYKVIEKRPISIEHHNDPPEDRYANQDDDNQQDQIAEDRYSDQQFRTIQSDDNSIIADATNKDDLYLSFESYTQQKQEQGLYIPPEIPLDSYVPPPVQQPLSPPTKPYQQQQLPIYIEPPTTSNFPTTYEPTPQLPTQQPAANFPVSAKPSYPYQPGQQYAKHLQSNYLASSNKIKNASPTPFNPSPLSYDKLAKFDQPATDQTYAMPPVRRPLAVPANTMIRNTSPTPFGASPTFGSKAPSYMAPRAGPQMPPPVAVQKQPQYQPPPQSQYQPPPQAREVQQPFYPPPEDNYYNNQNANVNVGRVPSVDLSQCQNYNTAPRGWNQRSDYYRPITFSKGPTELPYTDF